MTILFKYTSRSRPELFERGLKSIIDNLNQPEKSIVLVSIDEDDIKVDQYKDIVNNYFSKIYIRLFIGKSNNKIDAINRDLNEYTGEWDLLVNMSDDMIFTVDGFDNVIRSLFTKYFPNDDGFLHLNDGHQGDNVSTLSIMDRKYYERDRYIYHPEYKSLWCDVEATEVAWMRGCYAYEPIIIFDHLHPAWGLAPNDAQYIASESRVLWDADKATIDKHRAVNYGIENPVRTFKYQNI